jgi:hypothetical protein
MELEGADGDVELEPGDAAAVADRPGVDLPGRRLQLTDDLQGADLRGAGDRPGRERRADQLRVAGSGLQGAVHVGDQVPHAGVGLRAQQRGYCHAAWRADPAEVVAHQVDDHHVLRLVFGRALERLALPARGCLIPGPERGALDRPGQHAGPGAVQEQLR